MSARDIVRSILDLLDQVDQEYINKEQEPVDAAAQDEQELRYDQDSEQTRFRQIYAMLDKTGHTDYANNPEETITDIDTVTTRAGGGMNARKHPDDIHIKDQGGMKRD